MIFDRLLDDAAMFPPARTPLVAALAAHREVLAGPRARFVGPFLCPGGALADLADLAALVDEPLHVVVVTPAAGWPAARDVLAENPLLNLAWVEADGMIDADVPVYVERGWTDRREPVPGERIKLRVGGEHADAFPDEATLAAALAWAVGRGRPFKLTAGLHHAVRHTDPTTGFEHHGFANVILAVDDALTGGDPEAWLAERDAEVVADALRALDAGRRDAVRGSFASFGTCELGEPIDDLAALGLLEGVVA